MMLRVRLIDIRFARHETREEVSGLTYAGPFTSPTGAEKCVIVALQSGQFASATIEEHGGYDVPFPRE